MDLEWLVPWINNAFSCSGVPKDKVVFHTNIQLPYACPLHRSIYYQELVDLPKAGRGHANSAQPMQMTECWNGTTVWSFPVLKYLPKVSWQLLPAITSHIISRQWECRSLCSIFSSISPSALVMHAHSIPRFKLLTSLFFGMGNGLLCILTWYMKASVFTLDPWSGLWWLGA